MRIVSLYDQRFFVLDLERFLCTYAIQPGHNKVRIIPLENIVEINPAAIGSMGTPATVNFSINTTNSKFIFATNTEQEKNEIIRAVSYTHLRAHETGRNLVCRLLLEKKK
eukprot:TRINITY_DN20536_c0_g1_i1.p1 TRINITY_DN20536_c0_g1~~TRINITY_DN20536_c0_g1_i1.p1  ORF type:complete len:110 (+),score=25.52 TRINITY_DN20536_c0_g1_i1:113-442(+)